MTGTQSTRNAARPLLLVMLAILSIAALVCACGGSDTKDESTTPKKQIAAGKAEQTPAEGAPAGQGAPPPPVAQVAAQATANPQAPAPDHAAPSGAPPTDLVRDALLSVRQGKYEAAIRQSKSALQRDEKYVPAMVVMARAYFHLNKLEFAESICDIALSINAKTGECYNIKGFIALKEKNDPQARAHFEKATQVQPSLGPPWLNLGAQYLKVKNFSAAIPALETAVARMPERPEAHLNLGSAYREAGQLVKAQNSYKKALQLRGNNYPSANFNLGVLFLDAPKFPGMDLLQQLNTAVAYFNKYKQQQTYLGKNDPVDGYIQEAQKKAEREQKSREREQKRKAREQAKPAPKAGGK